MNITSGRLRNILHEGCTDSEKWEIAKDLLEYRTGLPAKWQEDSSLETWFPLTAEELRNWRTWGIIEISVRNPNVAEYMIHWEGRATKAEAALAHKEYYDAMRAREIDMSLIPEPQRPFVAALLNQRDESYTQKEETVKENNKLRGLLAKGKDDCIYCGLPAVDMPKCAHGFPGCARADDLAIGLSQDEKFCANFQAALDALPLVEDIYGTQPESAD